MAHKMLLAPFKKFPQQFPIFKKSSDKWKEITLSNYNAVYGMLDDLTAQSFDNDLNLLAVANKRGEIKIYGSEGVVYTLVCSSLKSITLLKFLDGQGRLLSVTNDNDIHLWEYKVDLSIWEMTSTMSFGSILPNTTINCLDISHPLPWKSDDDNIIQLLLVGLSNSTIRQVLVIGNRFHIYDGNDLTVDNDAILERCQDLNKDFEFGEIISVEFNSESKDKFFVAFSNGLFLIMKNDLSEQKPTAPETVEVKENEEVLTEEVKIKETDDVKEEPCVEKVESEEQVNGEKEDKSNEEKVEEDTGEKAEAEKPKSSDDTQKPEEVKVEAKKIKESIQVPFVHVQMPIIVNYVVSEKKISSICWSNNNIVVIYHDSSDMYFYEESETGGKLTEATKVNTLQGDASHSAYHLSSFKRKEDNIFVFISKTEERPNTLCLVKGNRVEVEFDTGSKIIDYSIVRDREADDKDEQEASGASARALLILCESQLIAIDLMEEHYPELASPYLVLRIHSHITAVTAIIQVSASLFPNHKMLHEMFENWPLNTPLASSPGTATSEDTLNILATGHSDGTINIWQLMPSGVIFILASYSNKDLFKNAPASSNLITESSTPRRQVGHHLISNDEALWKINNIQLIANSSDSPTNSAANGLFCVAGNASGTVFVFKYDRSESGKSLVEIKSNLKGCHSKEDVVWNDSDAPELLDNSTISSAIPNLSHIIKLNPSLPVTALTFHPQWNMLAVGTNYGFVLVDLKQNQTAFSYTTLAKATKTSVQQVPLTVGQQLRKSMRQSFKKLKKLKPTPKHTSNDEKSKEKEKEKEKEEVKQEEDDKSAKENEKGEIISEKAEVENKEKIEEADKCTVVTGNENIAEVVDESETPVEISRKDNPSGTIRSLLIEATNLVSAIKEPCLFAGTTSGAIYAFELKFNLEGPIIVTLSKELHLQHKAPVLLMEIVNSNHVPLVCTNEASPYQRKWSVVEDKTEEVNDAPVMDPEVEVGPSGDSEDQQAKLKAGTLPAPQLSHEEEVEKVEAPRKSVDAGKDKTPPTNTTMKKSGTLPASFLQAIGKTSGNAEAHELLVVSEEQVKLFSLPTLKAKYKYKVVDTGHHFGHNKSNNIQECEQNCQEKKTENADPNVDSQIAKRQIRRISTVGLCKVHGSKQALNKWAVAVALTNGEIIALSVNNLKKYISNLYNANCPLLSSVTDGELNLVVSVTNNYNLQITDFSENDINYLEPLKGILIAESARPVIKVEEKVEQLTKTEEHVAEVLPENVQSEVIVTNGHKSEHMNGHAEANEIEEEKDQLGDETVVQNPSTTHHGDITMDSIKEYITNMDGNITVKTFESSTEKHISVNDGQVVTTIHEKQMKDGDVIKDETVKITSDTAGSTALTQ